MLEENQTIDPDKLDVDKLLKVGYAGILHERAPFQPEDEACFNDENAYVVSLEREYLEIPLELEFPHLKSEIDQKHHKRLDKIWKAVENNYLEFYSVCDDLQNKWTKDLPDEPDAESRIYLDHSAIKIRQSLQDGVRVVISKAEHGTPLRRWQREEKALRRMVYERSKIFIVSLRLYYEMLLETSNPTSAEENQEYVLPREHPLRNEIANRNRYLRLIDATHAGISMGKAAHHAQTKGRLRKTERKPYIIHGIDVTHAAILDIIPFTLEEGQSSLATLIGIIGPVHDIIEDTNLSMEDLVDGYIKRLGDIYDSSLDPIIKSGFKAANDDENDTDPVTGEVTIKRSLIKKRVLNLVKDEILKEIKQILRILSNNCKLTKDERINMVRECIAGEKMTRKMLKITPEESIKWALTSTTKRIPTKTFSEFPDEDDEDDGKTSAFLMRLHGLATSPKVRQHTLFFKLEDRANNVMTFNSTPPSKQRKILRTTTSRILAWAMLDHDNAKYPLYNALPRCIDATLKGYEELYQKSPKMVAPLDHTYIAKLREWQTSVKRFEVSAKIQSVLDRNRELKKAA